MIEVIDNPNSLHAFNRFEKEDLMERYNYHFRLIDLTKMTCMIWLSQALTTRSELN